MDSARKTLNIASLLLKIASIGLPIGFVWLKLSGVPVASIIGGLDSNVVHQVAIAAYFFSWIAGCGHDLSLQKRLLHAAAASPRLPRATAVAGAIVILSFVYLCLATDPFQVAIALLLFFSSDYISWRLVMRRYVTRVFKDAYQSLLTQWPLGDAAHRNRITRQLMEVSAAQYLLVGRWIPYRYLFGFGLVALVWLFELPGFFNWWNITVPYTSAALSRSITFLMFVIVVELTVWHKRLSVRFLISYTPELLRSFEVEPKVTRGAHSAV